MFLGGRKILLFGTTLGCIKICTADTIHSHRRCLVWGVLRVLLIDFPENVELGKVASLLGPT